MPLRGRADLSGRVAIVTGANSGIGLEVARGLAGRGARVVLACRSKERADLAIESVRSDAVDDRMESMRLDLASLASVRSFSDSFASRFDRLDILVNNGGVMVVPHARTVDGFEIHFGTNHLGHFALTGLLLGPLLAAPSSRVVTVTSAAYRYGRLEGSVEGIEKSRPRSAFGAYARSKLANLLFALELNRRLEKTPSFSVAAHPGGAATGLGRQATELRAYRVILPLLEWLSQSASQAARSIHMAATDPGLLGGELIGPGGPLALKGDPGILEIHGDGANLDLARQLWSVSEKMTGTRYLQA